MVNRIELRQRETLHKLEFEFQSRKRLFLPRSDWSMIPKAVGMLFFGTC